MVLLSMTNRYGRVIDRSRILSDAVRRNSDGDTGRLCAQLRILARRARLLRTAIALTTFSILLVALLIIVLFLMALTGTGGTTLIVLIFSLCMLSLVGGLVVFIVDINVSLSALNLENEVWEAK